MTNYKAIDIANWLIFKAAEYGDLITHLKVQKLLYYSEAWVQALLDKELFRENIQAWSHGPVVPEVFHALKSHQWNCLPVPDEKLIIKIDNEYLDVLNQVFDTYADIPAKTLELMTHNDEPWINARGHLEAEERCEVIMPKNEIKIYFKNKYLGGESGKTNSSKVEN